MLLKYYNLPGHFHDLKATLQAEFDLLKKATSKNIQNIQEAVQSQQAYTTALYSHNTKLYTKLAQLDKQVQTHCIYPHPQLDVVQLNAPDYNPDIDGQPDPVTDLQSPNAKSITEDTVPNTTNSEQHAVPSTDTNRPQSHQLWMILITQGIKTTCTQGKNTPVITALIGRHPRTRDR